MSILSRSDDNRKAIKSRQNSHNRQHEQGGQTGKGKGNGNGPVSEVSEKILIGRVSGAHGLRGEITVVPLTDFPERFRLMQSVSLYRQDETGADSFLRRLELQDVRLNSTGTALTLRTDLTTREEAEACIGAAILIEPEERVALPEGHFWVDDLIGLQVEDLEGHSLGVVKDILSAGANELYEVLGTDGRVRYIPAVDEFIRGIDIEKRRLRVALIEGLWD